MDCIEALVDRSLVVASMTEPVRFRLLENLRVAIRACARDRASNDERLLLAYTLWRYMVESGRIPEGLAWLTLGLSPGYTEGTLLEARALHTAGFLMGLRGDFDGARAKIDRAVQLCRELDEPSALAWMFIRNGLVLSVQGASSRITSLKREPVPVPPDSGNARTLEVF